MLRLRNFLRSLRSVDPEEEERVRRGADSLDAHAAATGSTKADGQGGEWPGSVPPNYIRTYDEGRPRP
jgi:hypothetical protein